MGFSLNVFLLTFCQIHSCSILRKFYTVGIVHSDGEFAKRFPVIAYNQSRITIGAYFLSHKNFNSTMEKLLQLTNSNQWQKSAIVCIESDVYDGKLLPLLPSLGIPNALMETPEGIFIFNQFKNEMHAVRGEIEKELQHIWSDLNGFQIRISVFQHQLGYSGLALGSGLDGSFLLELSSKMNFTPVLVDGKNYTNSISQILSQVAEFGANAMFIKFYAEKVELSHVVYNDEVCVVVRSARVMRGWDVFLQAFHWQVWAMILLTALTTNWALKTMCPRLSWTGWLPLTLRAMFMIPLRKPPKTTIERIIIGGCLLFGVVIVTTYQASLYHFMRARLRYKDPEKLSEVEIIVSKENITDELFHKRGAGVPVRRKEFELMVRVGILRPDLHIVPECRSVHNLGYPIFYGSPFTKHINRFATAAFEAGLPLFWYRKTLLQEIKHSRKRYLTSVRALDIIDFEVAFFSLFLGLSLSTITLLLELLSKVASNHWVLTTHLDPLMPYTN